RGIVDKILDESRRAGISRICNLGDWPYGATQKQVVSANNHTMRFVRWRPDVFVGFCFLNPNHAKSFIFREITRCVENGNLKGIKLEVETNARSKRLDPIMEACARLNIPVLHHAWYKTVGKVLNESTPADIADLAGRHPNTKIIMAHLTAAGIRGVLDIQSYPNVYVDTSGSQPFSGIIEYAVAALGAQRILYGSDIIGRDFSCQLGRVYGANINRHDRDLILGINAKKLLRLP
ncbi:MAG: amidohydrolase family protein, partial [Verrucomicrobia bacterium]|nr:amidohydrolase family protein [Verrucomicrobiota bacterium]